MKAKQSENDLVLNMQLVLSTQRCCGLTVTNCDHGCMVETLIHWLPLTGIHGPSFIQ